MVGNQAQEQEVIKTEEERKDLKQGEVMGEVKKMLGEEKGEPLCAWLPNQGKGLEFLVCVYENQLTTPYLFHYDLRNQLGKGKRVKQVENITFTLGPSTMKFKNESGVGVKGITKLYLTTLFRQKHTTLTPERNCQITKNARNYQFTCTDSNQKNQVVVGRVDLEPVKQSHHKTLTR
ncbi:hypothetical protein [Mycoplasma wenyonii]|uniref:hypothetical protein n=1 Tax=Mycoplasma wenyonii TaxID=65123 RepID=UPI000319F933|nr:hypothetical protein [Mycoplasma wenyonii]